jgi:hypothetical protein
MTLPLLPEQATLEQEFEAQFAEEMGAIDFAESLPENASPEQMDKIAPALIRFLLQSGEKGYKDGVDEISDAEGNPPNQANNWLYDQEQDSFSGQFIDRRPGRDRVFQFVIEREGDGWVRSFSPISGVED